MINKCPGQDSRKISAETIACSSCGYLAEIFSDEPGVKCAKCGKRIRREALPSCAKWCKAARECLGFKKNTGG